MMAGGQQPIIILREGTKREKGKEGRRDERKQRNEERREGRKEKQG